VAECQKRNVLTRFTHLFWRASGSSEDCQALQEGHSDMHIDLHPEPLIALIAGIVILIAPRILNYVVAIYLIVLGLLGLFPHLLR